MNKDQVKGKIEESKGAVKEITGKVLDDKGMEIEGNIQKNVGITSLNDAIDHAKIKHLDLAKKSAEEAVTHLKAAQ